MDHPALPHQHGEGPQTARIQEQLCEVEHFQTIADVFKQLGDATRVRIFWLLCHCEECVVNISAMLGMSSPAVSHHLRPLRDSGLVISRRDGKEVYYRAADTVQSRLLHQMMEQVMEITCPRATEDGARQDRPGAACGGADAASLPPEQLAAARAVHEQLLQNMEQRVTIEALAKQYLVNPTTLKAAFKAVYGNSIAAHIKEHRMERAAELLRGTEMNVAEIARAVGYDSQSKFSAAFKSYFRLLPSEYRKAEPSAPRTAAHPAAHSAP